MTFYFPYGLIAIGLSMYAFNIIRKKRKKIVRQRRGELKDIRQEWLDHQLGRKQSPVILYGEFMEHKISTLKEVGGDRAREEIYYFDEANDEKWVREFAETPAGGPAQLRKVRRFPFE